MDLATQEQALLEHNPTPSEPVIYRKGFDLAKDGGCVKEILKEGTGPLCMKRGYKAHVHYSGFLDNEDGELFDSSIQRGEHFSFVLGAGQVIDGWDWCISSMRVGEKCKLTLAPLYAYGKTGNPPTIPPDATICFLLELLDYDPILENVFDKIGEATRKKEAANAYFAAQEYFQAFHAYDRALKVIDLEGETEFDESQNQDKVLLCTADEDEKITALKTTIYLNQGACQLALLNYRGAISCCDKALEAEPKNIKGLFRRAKAYQGLGEFQKARENLDQILKIDESSQSARQALVGLRQAESAFLQEQTQLFSRMLK